MVSLMDLESPSIQRIQVARPTQGPRSWDFLGLGFPYSCRQPPPQEPKVVLDSAAQVHLPFTSLFGRFRILPLH